MITAGKDVAESLFSWRTTEPREPTKLGLCLTFLISSERAGFVWGLAGELGPALLPWEGGKVWAAGSNPAEESARTVSQHVRLIR